MANFFIIHYQIHKPKSCSFTYGSRLCRLKMCKTEARHILILICKFGNRRNSVNKLFLNKQKCFTHSDNICIITYIAACCTKVDDRFSLWALFTVSVNMAHYIVAKLLFILFCNIIIDIICICFKFINLLLGNIKSEFLFSFCKSNPKLSPSFKLKVR